MQAHQESEARGIGDTGPGGDRRHKLVDFSSEIMNFMRIRLGQDAERLAIDRDPNWCLFRRVASYDSEDTRSI